MSISNLTSVERKVLGALLINADDNLYAKVTLAKIAITMGYVKGGGQISSALRALELQNMIAKIDNYGYKIFI